MQNNKIIISDLEDLISEKIFLKIENWNLYLGDAGLARQLAIECLRNIDQGNMETTKIAVNLIQVKIGDGDFQVPLSKFITNQKLNELANILEELSY